MSQSHDPTPVGALIAFYRNQMGLTQAELSEKVGMSQEWTSQVERGKIKRPRVDVLMRIAKTLDAPLDQLIQASAYGNAAAVLGKVIPEEIEDPQVARAFTTLQRLSPDRLNVVQAILDGLVCLEAGVTGGNQSESEHANGQNALAGGRRSA